MQKYSILLLALFFINVESTNLLRVPISSTSKLEENNQDGANKSNFDDDSLYTIDEIGKNFQPRNISSMNYNISCSEKCKDIFQSDFSTVIINKNVIFNYLFIFLE